jgi:hypothetical protein
MNYGGIFFVMKIESVAESIDKYKFLAFQMAENTKPRTTAYLASFAVSTPSLKFSKMSAKHLPC